MGEWLMAWEKDRRRPGLRASSREKDPGWAFWGLFERRSRWWMGWGKCAVLKPPRRAGEKGLGEISRAQAQSPGITADGPGPPSAGPRRAGSTGTGRSWLASSPRSPLGEVLERLGDRSVQSGLASETVEGAGVRLLTAPGSWRMATGWLSVAGAGVEKGA